MADGSIIIDTRIDTGGVSKGMNAVKAGMARISAQVSKMLESEQRFEIIGTLRRMPQNFLFKGLPDDIKDDYKLMDF